METKMNNANHFHGSDLETIERQYGIPKEKIVSFSANVNPLGLSAWLKEELAKRLDVIAAYPDRDYTRLREAVGAYCHTPASHIVPGNGTTELISLTIRPRRPVHAVIQGPAYSEYEREVTACGGSCSYYRLEADEDFIPHTDNLLACLTDDTDMLILCNPNNPTGYLYTQKEMNQIRDIVKKNDLFLFSDEVYREYTYTGAPYISAFHLPGIEEQVVLIDSVSKRYSECGIRIGAIITKHKELKKNVMKFCQARLSPPLLGQIVAEASINASQEYMLMTYNEYVERRKFLIDGLNRIPGVYSPIPMGAFYTVVSLPVDDADKFCEWCLKEFEYEGATIFMAPASGFYTSPGMGKNEVRMAYVLKKEELAKALKVLSEALKAYPGRTD